METIQDSIALKQACSSIPPQAHFGTIQNSITLKPTGNSSIKQLGFGTIQNSIALKPGIADFINFPVFWDHSKQHSSKTS
ncbi:hypothetical protein [Streptococcus pyogenes]|uniref:hypothetical protein n=1 Tax=Streptococcus pyogenes TaxID=1314 RepID=UPI0038FD1864